MVGFKRSVTAPDANLWSLLRCNKSFFLPVLLIYLTHVSCMQNLTLKRTFGPLRERSFTRGQIPECRQVSIAKARFHVVASKHSFEFYSQTVHI